MAENEPLSSGLLILMPPYTPVLRASQRAVFTAFMILALIMSHEDKQAFTET